VGPPLSGANNHLLLTFVFKKKIIPSIPKGFLRKICGYLAKPGSTKAKEYMSKCRNHSVSTDKSRKVNGFKHLYDQTAPRYYGYYYCCHYYSTRFAADLWHFAHDATKATIKYTQHYSPHMFLIITCPFSPIFGANNCNKKR